MFWLRLLGGFGIGGVVPNVVAINTESAPRKLRATLAIIGVGFVPFGGAIPGFVAATLVPHYGWQILFWLGGLLPIIFAIAAIFGLPESIKFMALHPGWHTKLARTLAGIKPGFKPPPNAQYVIEHERQFPGSNPTYLFRDGLALITPLLWLLFALNLMGYYFLISWTPTLMSAAKLSPTTVALSGSMLQIGGTVGALALCWWLQKYRFLAVAILFVIAAPLVGAIGYAGLTSQTALLVTIFFAGVFVLGIQSAINVIGALVYPTSLRANGSGWQLGIGRIGSIAGPLFGALFVGLPVERLYMWSALPFAVGAVVCFAIYRLNEARLAARPELRDAQ
jgi:AAHS family 4-hydroxybenzoate transporter-like MFS transporter